MYYYKFMKTDDPEYGSIRSSVEDMSPFIQSSGGDYQYYVPCEAPTKQSPTKEDINKNIIQLLRESDWTQLLDTPLTPEEIVAWKEHRQALRDLDTTDPATVVLPTAPITTRLPNTSR